MTIAVLTRAESEAPRSPGLQMATVARRLPDGGAIG